MENDEIIIIIEKFSSIINFYNHFSVIVHALTGLKDDAQSK